MDSDRNQPQSAEEPRFSGVVYEGLSEKTKTFLKEVEQDGQSLYDILCELDNLLGGKISEDTFLKHFYGRYRPSKCNYMNEEK